MKGMLKSQLDNLWLLTKTKEVQALVIGYDYTTGNVLAQLGEKRALLAPEDISVYQKNTKDKLENLLGSTITCKVVGKTDKDILLSRKEVMQRRIKNYQKGQVVVATVVSASDKALFLEFDEGLSAIMYLNQITSAKVKKPLDLYKIGDKVKCVITKKKENEGYFELSRLALYKNVILNIKVNDNIKCKITKKLDDNSGYFVEVVDNPLYSGIFDLNRYNCNNNYKIGEIITLRVAEVTDKKHLRLRTIY